MARSGVLANRIWKFASDAAMRRSSQFDEQLLQRAINELTNLMAYAYLLRIKLGKTRRRLSKDVRIEFSEPVHVTAKRVAGQIDINLGNVRKRFEPVAKKAMMSSARDIRHVINRALAHATRESFHVSDSVDLVLSDLRKHGIQPRATSYVETLVRTHSAISYGAAHRASFLGDPDLWGFEYVTVGDDRVRPEHEKLDGVRRKADDSFWKTYWPPNGWNCRCQAVAIYDESARQTKIPIDAEIDEGFETDFTELI